MKILRNIEVPTGNICIAEGDHGKLEFLSLGDYGKQKNIKASFMGLDREIDGVPHGELLPLSEKWVITISSQYGCDMGCEFCDVPKVGPGRNATVQDMVDQVKIAMSLHPEITQTKRLNIHFARMGEPTWNPAVIQAAHLLHGLPGCRVHPVVSTMMPKHNPSLPEFIADWVRIKNETYEGNAGLQLSINSTDEVERQKQFHGNALSLLEIARVMKGLTPKGRKFTLNFALADYTIDAHMLVALCDPEHYICKITPMHMTAACKSRGISTPDGYVDFHAYRDTEERLKAVGYDVIVFVPSVAEDESRITCGNAILADREEATGEGT